MRDALAPLAEALSRQVEVDTTEITAEAEKEAAELVAAARREARNVLADARADGAAQARADAVAERVHAERRVRHTELAARREALDELYAQSATVVRALRADPCYPRLLDRLSALARNAGGTDMVVKEQPDGGVLAEGHGRRVDCTLSALAARAVDALGAEVERLWAP
ncbi:V-type ATP synthase subunit E family protein [Streptosporangium amethystogenes]|uniref:V-type ATP synthase subunit E family protein n=1 Tax=Streptosporangium amethystogenes TaxID=2002 RepID=UPI0012F742F1|nr:V-type ATP synthase subunit E family protein [Streptosporangium amethystogenes]